MISRLVHIPIDVQCAGVVVNLQVVDTSRKVCWAVCACGAKGPRVAPPADPREALAVAHGAPEPVGCRRCGVVNAGSTRPWVRYAVVQVEDGWDYVCSQRSWCDRRIRARLDDVDTDDDILQWADPMKTAMTLSIDDVPDFGNDPGLTEAFASYDLARRRLPHSWRDLAESPRDQRAALGVLAALPAIRHAAREAERYYILVALKAGCTWQEISDSDGEGFPPDQLQQSFIADQVANYDWPDSVYDEIRQLTGWEGFRPRAD